MHDVAIIGVGIHPFGRFGDKSPIDMAAEAVVSATADAGVEWKDIQFGYAGSHEISNLSVVTSKVGLTGIPFTNVQNACATAASSRYCARSSFSVEPTCLVALMAAANPTRDTDRPTFTAGRTPELNRSVSKKI